MKSSYNICDKSKYSVVFRRATSWRESSKQFAEAQTCGGGRRDIVLLRLSCYALTRATVLKSCIWSQEISYEQWSWLLIWVPVWILRCFNPQNWSSLARYPCLFLISFYHYWCVLNTKSYKWSDWLHGASVALENGDYIQRSSSIFLLSSQSNHSMLNACSFAKEQNRLDTVLLKSILDVLFWTLNSQSMINCTYISSGEGVFQNVFFPGIHKEMLNRDVSY